MTRKRRIKKKPSTAKGGDRKNRTKLSHAVLVLLFFFAFSIFGLRYIGKFLDEWSPSEIPPVSAEKAGETKPVSSTGEDARIVSQMEKVEKQKPRRPRVILIIDDLGRSKESIDRLLRIEQPLNLAVLPHLPHSHYTARAAYSKGKEVILHLPMEPKFSSGYTADDAGEGVLLLGSSIEKIIGEIRRNIKAVPHIVGVNNHMGSKFMENEETVRMLMKELKSRGLYFVDSLTTPDSRGYSVAKQVGVKILKRDIFIDQSEWSKKYVKGREYTIEQLDRLVRVAEKNGIAVGIGHPYPQTIDALEEYMPKIEEKVEFMKISAIALN